jgi:RHS repeat-associated protein
LNRDGRPRSAAFTCLRDLNCGSYEIECRGIPCPKPGHGAPCANNNQMSSTSTNSNQGQGYDLAGNVNNDGAHQYLYDGDGRICEVLNTLVGVTTAYIYDADGRRVAKGSANWGSCDPSANGFQASTDYVLGPGGEQVTEVTVNNGAATGVAHTNAWAGSMLLATYDINGLHFYIDDPLGTRRVQTDYAGVQERTCQSLPFGDGETCSPTPTEHLFTGKERDTESGNDYFDARYYGSSMGRFLSPDDDSDQNPPDPQSWNLYEYVRNNPLTNTDDDGHTVHVCSTLNGTQHCTDVDDDVYKAAQQQSNGSLNGTSLADLQNSSSHAGSLTSTSMDANGNTTTSTVGSVSWTPDNPGIQGPQAIQAFGQIARTGNGAIKLFGEQMAWNLAGGLVGGLAVEALAGSEAAVDLANISNKIVRQMVSRNWTTKEIADVVERGVAHEAINKATGGAATEFVDAATGRFVVVDNTTKQVLQVSGSGHLPNYLMK